MTRGSRRARTIAVVVALSVLLSATGSDSVVAQDPHATTGAAAAPAPEAVMIEGPIDPTDLTLVDGVLYFVAEEDGDPLRRLWRSNGTNEGTYPIDTCRTILVCGAPRPPRSSSIDPLQPVGGLLYFLTTDGLWRSDGTSAGTVLLAKDADVHGGRRGQVPRGAERDRLHDDVCDGLVQGRRAYLIASSDCYDPAYRQLWVTDGSRRGTRMLIRRFDADPNVLSDSSARVGRQLLFPAYGRSVSESEIWVTDGTRTGTRVLTTIRPGLTGGWARHGSALTGDRHLFVADDDVHGSELWVTDGTTRGTRMVRDIRGGRRGSDPWLGDRWPGEPVPALGDSVLFVAGDGVHGRELWVTDGTREGTRMVLDIRRGPDSSIGQGAGAWHIPEVISRVGDRVYLVADDGIHGRQLWATDGSEAGTRMITNLTAAEGAPTGVTGWEHGDTDLLLLASRSSSEPTSDVRWTDRAALWMSDGTPEGTSELRQLGAIDDECERQHWSTVAPSDDLRYLVAPGGGSGCRLWRTDGTVAGTFTLDDGAAWDAPVIVDGEAYFITYGGDWDAPTSTLWRTDGTRVGTEPVSRSGPEQMLVADGGFFFLAGDGSEGESSCRWSSCRLWYLPTGDDVPGAPPSAGAALAPSPSAGPASGDLAAAFPSMVDGWPVTVTEREGAAWIASYDPADPDDAAAIAAIEGFVADLDREVDDLSVAYALARVKGRPAAITAVRVGGVRPGDLVDAVIPFLFADTVEPARERKSIAGKRVIRVTDAAIPGANPRYVYPDGDTVWLVEADARYLDEIIGALP